MAAIAITAIVLEALAWVKLVPDAIDAVTAFFRHNPAPTMEDLERLKAEYADAVAKRRASVDRFNEGLGDPTPGGDR